MSDIRRGKKTLTGEDELEVDKLNLVGEGLGCNDDYGNNGEILQKSVATNEIEWATFVIPDNSIVNSMLTDNCVTEDEIADNSISEDKIEDNAVTEDKIDDGSVTSAKIASSTIVSGNLANDAVTRLKIGDGEIHNELLAENTIASSKIGDAEIQGGKIANNTIATGNIISGAVTTSILGDDAVTTAKIAPDAVGLDELGPGSVVTSSLTTGIDFDTFGSFTMRRQSDNTVVLEANKSYAGLDAGEGSVVIGENQQIGLIIDKPPQQGTFNKGLIFGNAFEAIIPLNAGTGWLPLQIKTAAGAAGDKFKVDIDGNLTSALKIQGNNFATTGNYFTVNQSGDIVCNDVNAAEISAVEYLIKQNQGFISFQNFTDTALVGSSADKTNVSEMRFNSNTNIFHRIDFDDSSGATTLTGNSYNTGGNQTVVSYMDFRSETNIQLPTGVYNISTGGGTVYRKVLTSGDWRPNDDTSYYNLNIVDTSSTYRGKAQVDSSSMEMVAIISIPQGWKATKFRINASTALVVDAYKIYNTATTGSTNLTYGTNYTNNEINLYQTLDAHIDTSLMLICHTTSTSQYVSGGYITLELIPVGGH